MTSSRVRGSRPNWWIVVPVIWAVPGIIAMLAHAPAMYGSRAVDTREWIFTAMQFPRYMLWAPLTPLIFAAVRRFPFQRPALARSIAIHAGIAVLCIAFVEVLSEVFQAQLINALMPRRLILGPPSITSILRTGSSDW